MRHETRPFRSIAARLSLTTTALVASVLVAVVAVWTTSQQRAIRDATQHEASSIATSLAAAWANELIDENWSQIRTMLSVVIEQSPDIVYVFVTDRRQHDRVIAAVPAEQIDRFVPDLVPLGTTDAANADTEDARELETHLLRDVTFEGETRARRGDRIVEVAADIRAFEGTESFGVLRVGISTARIERVLADTAKDVVLIAAGFLVLGLLGSLFVAQRIASPVRSLERSASRMAEGDLAHRANVQRTDEIGALAATFNDMAGTLEASFGRLEATLTSFERFVPRKFLGVVAPDGIEKIRVGERATRTITILFSDIRGYTSLSEAMSAEQMFELLNDYLARMGNEIDPRGGFIDKYIGDAIMALFDEEHTDEALLACLAMRRSLAEWNVERKARGEPPIDTGIGLHRGEVIMGTVGYRSRIDSTVIGDAVNLASRIEGMTKNYGCAILVTDEVKDALLHPERFKITLVDAAVKVKGKDIAVALYSVEEPANVPRPELG